MLQITVGNPRFPQKTQLFTGNMILELTLREAKDICQTDMTLYGTWTALQRHKSISCTMQLVSSLQEFSVDSSVGLQSLSFATQHITSKHDNLREHQTFICLQILFYFVNVNILPTCIHCFCLEPKEGSSRGQIPLELQTVVSLYRGVGNQSHVLLKSSKCS